ncbi:MAG: hypothetical protein AAGA75_01740 [Cyanobacteria bacterium P01_E01_bin.6]
MLGKCRIFVSCVVLFLLVLATASPAIAVEAPDRAQNYAAKVICGKQPDLNNLQLVQGFYTTVVNILNTDIKRQKIELQLALAHPPDQPAPGEVFDLAPVTLDAGQAAAVDCEDIQVLAFPFGLPDTYIDGFLVVQTDMPLSVQSVYTAAPLVQESCCKSWPGSVASIDVEQIDAVPAPVSTLLKTDLLPDSPTLEADPLGAPGTGFCSQQPSDGSPPNAVALIINQGEVGAPASIARFDFGVFGQNQTLVPALEPGEKYEIGSKIPRDCFGTGRSGTCPFDIIADANLAIDESLETNNIRRGHCLRAVSEVPLPQ